MGALMKRRKAGKERNKRRRGPCSYCGRVHPRGKKRRIRLQAEGKWKPCKSVVADRKAKAA